VFMFLSTTLGYLRAFVVSRHSLALETVALRQQLAVYERKQPRRKLHPSDRLFWVLLRRLWSSWSDALILVRPDTVNGGAIIDHKAARERRFVAVEK
jgi:hypothetical protein